MKPKKTIKTKKQLEDYLGHLMHNAMGWLKLDGYILYINFPGDNDFTDVGKEFSFNIDQHYPYKDIYLSVQQDTIDKAFNKKLNSPFWKNLERSIFHEATHILSREISELAERRYTTPTEISNAEEKMVDHLSNVIYEMVEQIRKK